ncbi:hypothetical protein SAMN05216203_3058 [Marinobacter daqiaonensis]|uniref:Fe-S protein n=1 Tax=Marinobacter daqiaonensis TaxID=650891 RepID=A0A1I6JIG9_9GAMM|nr:DUF1289 domain-containing protein [Marinobacter daqiaonensis]SFR78816.1 hypothetical protein SAMN05216203_3058 [Marinobacter daqiaonensis]
MSGRSKRVASPCVSVCALDENDVCIGCHRTGDEILHWTRLDDDQRRDVLRKVSEREQRSII